ncbi:carbonic anhydrase, partial [Methylobacterium sp. CCH5-D2]
LVAPAEAKAGDSSAPDYLTRLEHAMVSQSIENLLTFPFIKERVDAGKVQLHGAHFGVASGQLLVRDPETGDFTPAADASGQAIRPAAMMSCN